MTRFKHQVVIQKPLSKVFAYATDLKNNIQWQKNLEKLNITSGNSTGPGATYHLVNRIMGQRVEVNGIISEYEVDRQCVYKVISGPVTGQSRLTVEPSDSGTKVTIEAEADLSMFRFLKSLVAGKAKKQLSCDLKLLKDVLEKQV